MTPGDEKPSYTPFWKGLSRSSAAEELLILKTVFCVTWMSEKPGSLEGGQVTRDIIRCSLRSVLSLASPNMKNLRKAHRIMITES